ncbi:hypothetical protein [Winogradskyella sp.]|uniref:hypothetical protein n=1 Tax=Winogradskyella sp. TaxID=1883156 RepID=UPI0026377A2C|nr:hypothetical protein [Winogradskyella sp.]
MKIKKIILYIILALVLLNFVNRQCSSKPEMEVPKISIVRDTVWQTKTDTFKIQTIDYKTVYVDTTDVSITITKITDQQVAPKDYIEAKTYRDTLSNDDIDIFSYNLLQGQLLDSKLSYKLKVPREINITKTIEHPKTYRSGLYMFSEIGGNPSQFNNLSLGLQYNRKGKWFISYRANFNDIQQTTHNVGVGFRLFR